MEWKLEIKLNPDKASELSVKYTDIKGILFFKFQIDTHGIDWDESPPETENSEAVIVDEIKLNLIDQQMEQLRRNINPQEESNSEGIALYLQTIHFLNKCLES